MPFVQAASPNVLRFPTARRCDKLPPRVRTALIAGGAAALWAAVLLAGYAGYHVVGALV
jgi:hypothetical protein